MRQPLVSVIVLNHNGRTLLQDTLDSCLSSLIRTNYKNLEIVFVDNNSSDDSVEYVKKKFGRLKIISLDKNYGYDGGNNIGYENIAPDAKYIVFLNNDVIVEPSWLAELIKIMERNRNVGAAQPLVLNPDGSLQWIGFITKYGDPLSPRNLKVLRHNSFDISGVLH